MLALHRAGRQQEALDAYEATRRALDEQWGLEPSAETRALQTMILTQDPAIARGEPVARAVGAVRRPVSLLLVEPLLDDELELEAAGALLEDVRRSVADVAARHGGALSTGIGRGARRGVRGRRRARGRRRPRGPRRRRAPRDPPRPRRRGAAGRRDRQAARRRTRRPVLVGAVVGRTRRALHDAGADEIQLTAVAARLGGDAFELDADGRLLGVRPGRPRSAVGPGPARRAVGRARAPPGGVRPRRRDGRAPSRGGRRRGRHRQEPPRGGVRRGRAGRRAPGSVHPLRRGDLVPAAARARRAGRGARRGRPRARRALERGRRARRRARAARALHRGLPGRGRRSTTCTGPCRRSSTSSSTSSAPCDGPLLVVSTTRPELLERRPAWGEEAMLLDPLAR